MKKLFTIAALIIAFAGYKANAQNDLLKNTNWGTDFWLSFPPNWIQIGTSNYLKIFVTSESTVACTLEIPAIGKTIIKTVQPNSTIEFTLSPSEGQIYERANERGTALSEEHTYSVGKGRGIRVTAQRPIMVQAVSHMGISTGSMLVLPTSSLGKEYIVSAFADYTGTTKSGHLPSQAIIIATHDDTKVFFKLGGSEGTRTVGGMIRGQTKSFELKKKGDVLIFTGGTHPNGEPGEWQDISGSKITSTKPVAVITGNQSAIVPVELSCCSDFIMEMQLPTHTWGNEYHITNIANRKNYSYIKVFAKNPNTNIYYGNNPNLFTTLTTSGGNRGQGYHEARVLEVQGNELPGSVKIRADGPISITQYNSSSADDNAITSPFQMSLTPAEQYQKEIVVQPIVLPEQTAENFVNLVVKANSDGTMPVIELGQRSGDSIKWSPLQLGSAAKPVPHSEYYSAILKINGTGIHKFRSANPLTAYLYSNMASSSFGHPAAVSLKDLTKSDSVRPRPTYDVGCDGNVSGQVTDLPATSALRSNISFITLLDGSSNYRLQTDFIPGADETASWKLLIEDATKAAKAILYFSDRAGNDTTITIEYSPRTISWSTNTLDFGLMEQNQTKTLQITLLNTSSMVRQEITEMRVKDGSKFFTKPLIVGGIKLDPLEERTFDVHFTSSNAGFFKDSLLLIMNGCPANGVELKTQVGEPLINVTEAHFGTTEVNNSLKRSITIRNIGTLPLSIYGFEGPSTSQFTIPDWPAFTETDPFIVLNGQSLVLDVYFKSPEKGIFKDQILFKSNSRKTEVDSIALLTGNISGPSGIENEENISFTISPNPATAYATITLPAFKSENILLKVFDALGNEVADLSNNLLKTELRFDTKTLPNGAYFLRFTDGKTTLSRSFIIQN
jgi:hypothetical protein